ncbi:MAG: hypothetical protein EZS28_022602, partial [Streblomastix strix]
AKQIFQSQILSELLVSFLNPSYAIQKEYVEALDNSIIFMAPKQVDELVQKSDLIQLLTSATSLFQKDQPQISKIALKILVKVAKHGIKLNEGGVSYSVTQENFSYLMQQIEAKVKVHLPEPQANPFLKQFISNNTSAIVATILQQSNIQLQQYQITREYFAKGGSSNRSLLFTPNLDITLKLSDGLDIGNPEEILLHTQSTASAALLLIYDNQNLSAIHQNAVENLIENIYPIRLEQTIINYNSDHEKFDEMMKRRIEDANAAVIALSQFYRKQSINDIMSGPVIAKIRALLIQRNEEEVIEKLYILELILAQYEFRQQRNQLPLGYTGGSPVYAGGPNYFPPPRKF